MARRSRDEWLEAHGTIEAPIFGLVVRAGTPRSPRVIARLWSTASPAPNSGHYVPVDIDPGDAVSCWEASVDQCIEEAGSPGPCIRLELLSETGKPIGQWQETRTSSSESNPTDPISVLAASQAGLIGETRRLVETCTGVIQVLSGALVERDTMLVAALQQMSEAHVTAATTLLEAGQIVLEGTPDIDSAPADTSNLEGLLMQALSKFGGGIPTPPQPVPE